MANAIALQRSILGIQKPVDYYLALGPIKISKFYLVTQTLTVFKCFPSRILTDRLLFSPLFLLVTLYLLSRLQGVPHADTVLVRATHPHNLFPTTFPLNSFW
jgi:hypothetical protein